MTYYLQIGSVFASGGTVAVDVNLVPAPLNDGFATATVVSAVPFTDTQDLTGATTEPGEPLSSCGNDLVSSVWYSFTPTNAGTYSASVFGGFPGDVAVFTGSSLGSLDRVACGGSGGGGLGTWQAEAGATYYLQVGSYFWFGPLAVTVEPAPPPTAGFVWGPPSPSAFDDVQFTDLSLDRANVGIDSWTWDFGDGSTAEGRTPTHRYAADGDYVVTLNVTTIDGRRSSTSDVVLVRTHDIAIARFDVPNSSRVGRTERITVGVSNRRYPEMVQVQLLKSVPGGFEVIAHLDPAGTRAA